MKSNGDRVYVRFHDEEYMERELDEITKSHQGFKSMLSDTYKNDWKMATEYVCSISKIISMYPLHNDCHISIIVGE